MKKVVLDSHPGTRVPGDLRADLVDMSRGRIALEPLQDFFALGRSSYKSFDESVAHNEGMLSQ